LAAVFASSLFIGPRTNSAPCPDAIADNLQYVFLNAFDLIAADILQRNPVAENGFLIHACLIAAVRGVFAFALMLMYLYRVRIAYKL